MAAVQKVCASGVLTPDVGKGRPSQVAFGPGDLLAVALGESVQLWDLEEVRLIREIAPGNDSRRPVFSRDGRLLASGAAYCLWDDEAAGHGAYYVGGDTTSITDTNSPAASKSTVSQPNPATGATPGQTECSKIS